MSHSPDATHSLHELILQATARGWCSPENSAKVMDPDLAQAIASEVEKAVDEHYALQFAAIMTACIQNTPESAKDRIEQGHPYWTVAYGDVCTAIDREMKLLACRSEIESPADLEQMAKEAFADDDVWKGSEMWEDRDFQTFCARLVKLATRSAIGTPEVSLSGFPLHVHAGNRYMRSILIYNDNSIPEGTAELRGIDGRTLVKIVNLGD